jgi:hypothetical protein
MKKLILVFPLAFLIFSLTSCFNSDDENYAVTYQTLATVTNAGNYPSFLTDDGYVLRTSNEVETDTTTALKVGERYFLLYVLGDTTSTHGTKTYPIILKDLNKVNVWNYSSVEKNATDTIVNAGLRSVSFFGLGRDYLNIIFSTYKSTSSYDDVQLVRLKKKETDSPVDTMPTIYFELRHNVHSLNFTDYNTLITSFNLKPLVADYQYAKRFNVNLKWNIYPDATSRSYDFIYKPESSSSAAGLPMKNSRWSPAEFPLMNTSSTIQGR